MKREEKGQFSPVVAQQLRLYDHSIPFLFTVCPSQKNLYNYFPPHILLHPGNIIFPFLNLFSLYSFDKHL